MSAGSRGHDPEGASPAGESVGEPIWTGGASAVQLIPREPLTQARLHVVDVSGGLGARASALEASAASLALAGPELPSGAGQPPIIARRAWALGISPPRVAPEYGAVRMAFVHHTENPNGYSAGEVPAMLRAIYAFHVYTNGWNDIGYNFVVDLYGRIFEARAGGIDRGRHRRARRRLQPTSPPASRCSGPSARSRSQPHARHALQSLLAWKLPLHGVPARGQDHRPRQPGRRAATANTPPTRRVSLPRIAGHRDGDSTECPGDVLYGELPAIRARGRAPSPAPSPA